MQVIHERCAGIDIPKILPNRNHLLLMISQRASILMFFSSLDVVEDRQWNASAFRPFGLSSENGRSLKRLRSLDCFF